jgi:hypothetical protein
MTRATAEGAKSLARAYSHVGITNAAPADSHLPGGALPGGGQSSAGWRVARGVNQRHLYSWFIDLYVPCTGYNLYKTLPIFMHRSINYETLIWLLD